MAGRSDIYIDEENNIKYFLTVRSSEKDDWVITFTNKKGERITLNPPDGLSMIPGSLKQTIGLDIDKFRGNIEADEAFKKNG